MNFRKNRGREELEINLIPLIDLFLVIIIFLMVSTTYSKFAELQINLPTADAAKAADRPAEINVQVTNDGHYAIEGRLIAVRDAAGLAEKLHQAAGALTDGKVPMVVISADAQTTHQAVVNVMEAARMAGLSQVSFTTQTGSK